MKTLQDILYDDLVRTREHFAKLKKKRDNDPTEAWLRQTVAARLQLPKDTTIANIVQKLKQMSEEEQKKALKGIVTKNPDH
ncbi:hypothetical protein [uncultured Microscilla sp.]|uniref:hypothetical protein n=1 Tax=uncultured Microscilla sp. TaxID=432653 RepID=UPI002623D17A|nr:hypothetical protein [uncultured Microscilla sp.]